MNELLVNLMAYCAVPITAWRLYTRLYDRMEARGVIEPPSIQFFLIFTVYAGWAMVLFIALSRAWSDLMFLVLVYLLLVAPLLMLCVAVTLLSTYRQSLYHTWALVGSGLYFSLFAILIFLAIAAVVISPLSYI